MDNYIKYLATGSDEKKWDIYINSVGRVITKPNNLYPSKVHPSAYYFTWETGRLLFEYQILYITDGKGVFENKQGLFTVNEGSFIIIRSNEWHRYKPNVECGWTENYIGFQGGVAKHFMKQLYSTFKNPVINVGINTSFIDCYSKIFDLVEDESPSHQLVASGILIKLIALLIASQKKEELHKDEAAEYIDKIRFILRNNVENNICLQDIASELNTGYSYFRKMFKKHTGISPKQYHLQLKIVRAKELLLNTNKSVKDVCFTLGFHSTSYFSRVFKQKIGVSPRAIKNIKRGSTGYISKLYAKFRRKKTR